ncbi:hypothetical protein Mal4_01650 [Maioricimonas rarisocia]|uniref:Uncharacterized protein n=1 Tax=Maioricimonas rarisocia TaxID=2528026 RepID=A0A517Z0A7_9PLAN|nr:hypothetical protein [Maioricimonas rarisocia]QDU35883.1 hypothetical protein Mal4_01650 [Maioricimonas rarisocia]
MSLLRTRLIRLAFVAMFAIAPVSLIGCAEEESAATSAPDPGETAGDVNLDEDTATE